MMRIKTITLGLAAGAVLLAATAKAPAGTSLHWTSKAAPGYQHYYRMRGAHSAVCHERSALVIRCVYIAGDSGAEISIKVKVRLLSRTRVQYVFRNVTGLNVTNGRIPDKSWAA